MCYTCKLFLDFVKPHVSRAPNLMQTKFRIFSWTVGLKGRKKVCSNRK